VDTKFCEYFLSAINKQVERSTNIHYSYLQHGSCPTCRHPFLDIKPYTESDAESSDDEYFPDEDEDEEDDFFGMDEFDDELEVEEMEVDLDDIWGYVDLHGGEESDDEEEHAEPDINGLLEGDRGVLFDPLIEAH
jgi:hypothetical protein